MSRIGAVQASMYENRLKDSLSAAMAPLGAVVLRSAGSHGEGDLSILFPNRPGVLIEVKASKKKSIKPDAGEKKEQFEELVYHENCRMDVWYAYWLKRSKGIAGWRFFRPCEAIKGGKRGGTAFVWGKGVTFDAWLARYRVRGRSRR